jgi:hypothetical protein
VDETFVTPNTSHQCMETRTAMAYWQNGKLYVHCSTQSTAQQVPAVARWMGMDPTNVVVISEYTGGGFGSKITGDITLVIPALLAKKTGAPVMMRITREEENFIGPARVPASMAASRPDSPRKARSRPWICSWSATTTPYDPQRSTLPAALSRCCTSRKPCAGAG